MDGKDRRILVVDDEKAIRDVLSSILSFTGYKVIVASNGDEGLNLFLENPMDLVLTDLDMPGLDGVSLALFIKDKSPSTPVVLITGSDKEDVMERLRGDCVDSVMFKPFSLDDVQETVQRILPT